MLKRALLSTIGAFGFAAVALVATAPMAPAKADWTCDNCDCKCGRCHTWGSSSMYCCPCKKSNATSENSNRRPKVKSFQSRPRRQR